MEGQRLLLDGWLMLEGGMVPWGLNPKLVLENKVDCQENVAGRKVKTEEWKLTQYVHPYCALGRAASTGSVTQLPGTKAVSPTPAGGQ